MTTPQTRFVYKETTSGMFLLRDRMPPLPQNNEYYFDGAIAEKVDDVLAEAKAGPMPSDTHRAHRLAWQRVRHNQALAVQALKDAASDAQAAYTEFGCPTQALANINALTAVVTAHVIALCILQDEAASAAETKSGEH